jgi:hypothetical protein
MSQTLPNPLDQSTLLGVRPSGQVECVPYEKRVSGNLEWGMSQASLFFEGKGPVQQALRKVAARLKALGIDYVIVGGMAMFHQGFRRYTEDVDILVTRAGLKLIHEKLEGLGYVPPFTGSKHLRDTENGVKIEFLTTGDYPEDGKPKPVSFPDPALVGVTIDGISYLAMPKLIELKLASGLTNPDRVKDLGDVQELIKALNLPLDLREQLDPFVRDEFERLWTATRPATRFMLVVPGQPKRFDELLASCSEDDDRFRAMQADGVTLEARGKQVFLVTTDPDVARKYDMYDESEFLDQGTGMRVE